MQSQISTSIAKVKQFLKDDLEKALLPLKTKRSPDQKRHHKARARWFATIAAVAVALVDIFLVWQVIAITLRYRVPLTTLAPLRSMAITIVGLGLEALFFGWYTVNCWQTWNEIRLEKQATQATPDVGVWPPPPRRD